MICGAHQSQSSRGGLGRTARLLAALLLFAGGWLLAPPAAAQGTADEIRALREEIRKLRDEVAALRDELRRPLAPAPAAAPDQQVPVEARLEIVEAQLAEHAQTKVESNSRVPVKLFGTIVSSTFFNTGEANWLDIPNLVDAAPAAPLHRGSFSSNLRQSRIGAIVEGPEVRGLKTSGFIAFDFFGGIPNFTSGQVIALPRLLYAYARLEGENAALEVGQDQMIFAPANPTSLAAMAFPNLFRSGNLYLRAPQVRYERRFAATERSSWHFAAGILAPITGDGPSNFEFVPPNLAGERSRQPAVQGRLAWHSRFGREAARSFELGFSGHTGGRRTATDARRSWGVAFDFDARFGRFGIGGEGFAGQNIGGFGGSLGQPARSAGGFIEGRFRATQRLELNAGFGTDRLYELAQFAAALDRNTSVFANFIYDLTPELATSFEYRWLSTVPVGADARRNHHLNLVFAYRF